MTTFLVADLDSGLGEPCNSSPNPCIMSVMETQLHPKLKCVTVKIGHDRTTRRCRKPKDLPCCSLNMHSFWWLVELPVISSEFLEQPSADSVPSVVF